METGKTNYTASHGNIPLSLTTNDTHLSSATFCIDTIEVWRISFPDDYNDDEPNGIVDQSRLTKGVLDKFKEDRNFLSLAGKESYSDGIR